MDITELTPQQQLIIARQPVYPPAMSMAGRNTVSFHCVPVGYTPGYAVCLHKLAAYERDFNQLKCSPACERAIGLEQCEAKNMRTKENDAGKALFFVDRAEVMAEWDKETERLSPKRGTKTVPPMVLPANMKNHVWPVEYEKGTDNPLRYSDGSVGTPLNKGTPKPIAGQKPAPTRRQEKAAEDSRVEVSGMSFADAISKAVKDEIAANDNPAPAPVQTLVAKLPGESMKDYAQRVSALRKSA